MIARKSANINSTMKVITYLRVHKVASKTQLHDAMGFHSYKKVSKRERQYKLYIDTILAFLLNLKIIKKYHYKNMNGKYYVLNERWIKFIEEENEMYK